MEQQATFAATQQRTTVGVQAHCVVWWDSLVVVRSWMQVWLQNCQIHKPSPRAGVGISGVGSGITVCISCSAFPTGDKQRHTTGCTMSLACLARQPCHTVDRIYQPSPALKRTVSCLVISSVCVCACACARCGYTCICWGGGEFLCLYVCACLFKWVHVCIHLCACVCGVNELCVWG